MGLFKTLTSLAEMPIRLGVDVVKMPVKIVEGEDGLLDNTVKGVKKVEKALDEED